MFDKALIDSLDDMVQTLRDSLRIKSDAQPPRPGMPNGEGVARALEHALSVAEDMGFTTRNIDGQVGYAEYGQGGEMVAVLGHVDVVPVGDGWKYPPFSGEVADGAIYGRGAQDNKGPIFAALYGLKAIKDSGLPLKKRVRVIFGTCEETNMSDMVYYADREELPVAGFTPDSDFPVIYAEKGILHIVFSRAFDTPDAAADAAATATAAADATTADTTAAADTRPGVRFVSINCGTVANSVPDKAEAVLEIDGRQVRLESLGKAAHGSTPLQGDNAIFGLLRLLRLQDIEPEYRDCFAFLGDAMGRETFGEDLGLAMSDAPSGSLTANFGLLNGDRSRIKGSLDIRYPVTASKDEILDILGCKLEEGGFAIDTLHHLAPLYRPLDDDLVKTLAGIFAEKTGTWHEPVSTGGGTYARTLPNILAFGPRYPGEEHLFHQTDENITIDYLLLLSQIYAQAIYELAV